MKHPARRKKCRKCKQQKPLDQFHRNRNECKACRRRFRDKGRPKPSSKVDAMLTAFVTHKAKR